MDYTLTARAMFSIVRKDKALAYAERLFPDLPIQITGRYEKDNSLWEATLRHDCEYTDDKTALWEVLTSFREITHSWLIISGPNAPRFSTVLSAVAENGDDTGLAWCNFELLRRKVS